MTDRAQTTGGGNTSESEQRTSLPCLNDALAYAIVHGYPSDLAHAALRERQQADALDETGAYVEVNERGTPILYFPDGDQEDGVGYREATVAEWSFWRTARRLRGQLDTVRQVLVLIESQAEAFLADGLSPCMSMIRVRDRAHAARAALGVEGRGGRQ